MNYYQPLQRIDGRWDYTRTNDRYVVPIGYCREYNPFTVGLTLQSQKEVDRLNAEYGRFKDKYHTNGHAASEEACNCYREYQLDNNLIFHFVALSDAKVRRTDLHYCVAENCDEVTASTAMIRGQIGDWSLCGETPE